MKNPNPSDTTSTGIPAARARRERQERQVVRLGGGLRAKGIGVRGDQPDLPGHQPP